MRFFYTAVFRVSAFLKWRSQVRGARWLHSPFHFELYTALESYRLSSDVKQFQIEHRRMALHDSTHLNYEDSGAGSLAHKQTRVKHLARNSVLPLPSLEKLAAMATHVEPAFILELGTSLGFTSTGLAQVLPNIPVHSIEAAEPIHAYAEGVKARSGVKNLTLHLGTFSEVLPNLLPELVGLGPGLVVVDGHHTYAATVNYAKQLFAALPDYSAIVFDDIYWNTEMNRAWNEVRALQPMGSNIDGFRAGWMFLNPDLTHETFYWKIT